MAAKRRRASRPSLARRVYVAGVDGCRTGWVVALHSLRTRILIVRVVAKFADVLALKERPALIAVDAPIGLLSAAVRGGRICDREARAILGRPRSSSVFSPPVRNALLARGYRAACSASRASSPARIGISRQTWNLFDKLREVDAAVTPRLQTRLFEVHPELSFCAMASRPPRHRKKSPAGHAERLRLLAAAGFHGIPASVAGAARDDVLDAVAACWSARRIHMGTAARLPTGPVPVDARGLRMEIWR